MPNICAVMNSSYSSITLSAFPAKFSSSSAISSPFIVCQR